MCVEIKTIEILIETPEYYLYLYHLLVDGIPLIEDKLDKYKMIDCCLANDQFIDLFKKKTDLI